MRYRPGVLLLGLVLSACVSAQQARYIVYLKPDQNGRMLESRQRAALLERWQSQLRGIVKLERQTATGGWIITVNSEAASQADQQADIEALEGVESVDLDAVMRHQ